MANTNGATSIASDVAVLIVEDNWLVAASVSDALTDAGATVVGIATSVVEAMGLLKVSHIDAAILDFRLEGETASPVAHALQDRSVPFFFYTGSPETANAHPGSYILLKPSADAEIVKALKTVLEYEKPPNPL